MPVYYEACKDASPVAAGIDVFVCTFIAFPLGTIAAVIVTKTGRYRPQLWFAWVTVVIGFVLFSSFDEKTSRTASIAKQVPYPIGLGIVMTVCFFPVLAPTPVELHANALAFLMFLRFFSQVSRLIMQD